MNIGGRQSRRDPEAIPAALESDAAATVMLPRSARRTPNKSRRGRDFTEPLLEKLVEGGTAPHSAPSWSHPSDETIATTPALALREILTMLTLKKQRVSRFVYDMLVALALALDDEA